MTATLDTPLAPSGITDDDFRTVASVILRKVATWEINEVITETDADQRVRDLISYRPDQLTTEQRTDAYEQLKDALRRLSCYEMPGGCHCHDYAPADVDGLALDADYDAENAIRKLVGPRRPNTTGSSK